MKVQWNDEMYQSTAIVDGNQLECAYMTDGQWHVKVNNVKVSQHHSLKEAKKDYELRTNKK